MNRIDILKDSEGYVRFFGTIEKLDGVYVSIDVYEAIEYTADDRKGITKSERVLRTNLKWDGQFSISTECGGQHTEVGNIEAFCMMIRATYYFSKSILDGYTDDDQKSALPVS